MGPYCNYNTANLASKRTFSYTMVMFNKKTIKDIDLSGKCIILHGEFDAPLDQSGAKVTSDFRVASAIPTIQYLQKHDCKIILISKLGRPDGRVDPKQSLKPVAKCLADLMHQDVGFVADCVGEAVKKAAAELQPKGLLMLENLRFHPEEEADDEDFAKQIVADTGAELFVQDCFALAHRKEAGTSAITRQLPSVAGLHLQKEVDTITAVMQEPKRPLVAVIGGAKIADKIEIMQKFIELADVVAVAGAMANTFLVAQGIAVGKSKYEPEDLELARDLLAAAEAKAKKQPFVFYLPQDGVVAQKVDSKAATRIVEWNSGSIGDIQSYPKMPARATHTLQAEDMILDIGPQSAMFIAGVIQLANTVVWNGTLGVTEVVSLSGPIGPFAHGTETFIEALTGEFGNRPFSLVGGGDTAGYIEQRQLTKAFNHVSTGGGASLELMAGKPLPAVEALQNK